MFTVLLSKGYPDGKRHIGTNVYHREWGERVVSIIPGASEYQALVLSNKQCPGNFLELKRPIIPPQLWDWAALYAAP